PGGKGLQEYYTDMLKAVAAKFAKDPWVLGYEVMNEPWPGTSWVSCLAGNGCPALEQSELEPFYGKAAAAIRSVDPKHMIFFEPFVLYNFGYAPTHLSLPEGVVNTGLAYHQYAVNPGSAEQVFQNSIQWSKGTGGALLNTEWSNSSTLTGPPGESSISVQEGYEDTSLMPFTYWVFDNCLIACSTDQFGSMFYHPKLPPTGSNVNHNVVDSLVQPYPLAVSGTPSQLSYDPVTKKLSFGWDTTKPDGKGSFGTGSLTSFSIPLMDYPSGYSVQVTGGTSITKGSSDQLVVSQSAGVSAVSVVVTPKS
ncbi:MAG TPA: cellulase family glycosylhydrolase, partial [Acidimicrobiales bacterium]|nr:cellulase family glycosylhydrolase [Acidimicrobiales bacterium]